ncbi:SDR family oxidoreductase [Streptomyces sp. NPDC005426]|uniref:SDR family oxidoreductase n=1 Tax=Streptomyces sp. NPDC005426 TaxID=3155344 RepID=UPI0033A2C3C9
MVTGASRGIGRAIAQGLAARGAAVAVNYRSGKEAADQVVQTITSAGGHAVAVPGDISDPNSIHPRIFDTAESDLGPLDIVVSNAAIAINKPLSDYTLDDYRATFDTNTRGAFLVLQQAAARVRDNGRIIAVSTGGTRLLLAGTTLYLGSKGAVDQFVRGVAMDAGPRGITINTVSPGFTNTDLLTDDFRATAADMSPFGRVGEPEEVAAVVTFLASRRILGDGAEHRHRRRRHVTPLDPVGPRRSKSLTVVETDAATAGAAFTAWLGRSRRTERRQAAPAATGSRTDVRRSGTAPAPWGASPAHAHHC